jgi:hypothetical protein
MTRNNDFIQAYEALVNVTWAGRNGDLPDPVAFDATDSQVKAWVEEAVGGGGVAGIPADTAIDLSDFVVDRFQATEATPYNRLFVRPKTPFGRWAGGVAE